MVRVGVAITALTTLGNSAETQRTPSQVILIKLGQMAEGNIFSFSDSCWSPSKYKF